MSASSPDSSEAPLSEATPRALAALRAELDLPLATPQGEPPQDAPPGTNASTQAASAHNQKPTEEPA